MAVTRLGFFGTNGDPLPPAWVTSFTASGSATVQSNAAKLTTPTTVGAFSRMYWRAQLPSVDILVKVTPGQAWSTDAFLDIGVRGINDTPHRLYSELHGSGASNATLVRNDGTTGTIVATGTVTLTGSNVIWVRFRRIGNWFAVKWWDDGTVEPSDWTLRFTDTAMGPTASVALVPWFQCANSSTVAAAASHSFSDITLDDLIPVKARHNLRRF